MNERLASCLLIAKVLVADGMMAEHERAFLTRSCEAFGLTDAERQKVRDLEGFDEAQQFLSAQPAAKRQALVDQLVEAALVDGKLSPHETKTVTAIAAALGLR